MSGILKSIGKVFAKVLKSPIFKIAMIAVAVYFTAGLAAGAMGSAFAAGLPGIAGAAEGLGITAGAFAGGEAATVAAAAAANAGLAAAGAGEAIGMTAAEAAAATGAAAETVAGGVGAGAGLDASLGSAGIVNASGAAETAASTLGAGATDASLGAAGQEAVSTGLGGFNGSSAELLAGNEAPAFEQVTGTGFGGNGATGIPGSTDVTQTSSFANNLASGAPKDMTGFQGSQFGPNTVNTVPSTGTSLLNQSASLVPPGNTPWSIQNWWAGLDAGEKKIAFEGLSQGAKAAINAIGQKSMLDQRQKEIDDNKADVIRKGQVADRTSFYKTPGLVNAAVNGKG